MAKVEDIAPFRRVIFEFLNDIPEREGISILGEKVSSAKDLAFIGEALRSPRFETFHYIFTRDSDVVGTTAIACRRVNSTFTFTGKSAKAFYKDLLKKAAQVKADTLYLLHNHPSGNPVPSDQDRFTTEKIYENVIKDSFLHFGGHVVVNSTRYSLIAADGTYEIFDISYDSYNLQELRVKGSFFGTAVKGPEDLAALTKILQRSRENTFLAVGLSARLECNCLYEIGYEVFDFPTRRLLKAVHQWASASGVVHFALVHFSEEKLQKYNHENIIKTIADTGIILDIITPDGKSFRLNRDFYPGSNYRELTRKAFAINDYQSEYRQEYQPEFDFSLRKEVEDEENTRQRESQGDPAVPRHSDNHGTSGVGQYSTSEKSVAKRRNLDERFGELFMWAGRKRSDLSAQPDAFSAEDDSDAENGAGDQGNLLPGNETSVGVSQPDQTGGTSAGTLQNNLGDLNSSEKVSPLNIPAFARNIANFTITDPANLVPAGNVSRIKANLQAIKTLKEIEAAGRKASSEEQEILSHYVGWGGLKPLFKRREVPHRLKDYAIELESLLTEEEWESAAQSILNAHYTSPEIINCMWDAVEKSGFKGGQILEPAGGVGHFLGLMPEEIRKKSHIHTVECDALSARILAQLYPDAKNQQNFFEYASLKNNSMDLIISNVPFLENPHRDPRYPKMHLHDYFFNRGVDLLKPGGVMLAITTCSSLDSYRSRKSRQLLDEKADLVAAVRLPSNAFSQNAGAEVTTDILLLRKKDERQFRGKSFVNIKELPGSNQAVGMVWNSDQGERQEVFKSIEINEYFVNHPEMMLGTMQFTKGRFSDKLEQSLVANNENLEAALTKAFENLPVNLFKQSEELESFELEVASDEIKPYSLMIDDRGNVVQKVDGFLEKVAGFDSPAMKNRAADFIELRNQALRAVDAQVDPQLSDNEVEEIRLELCEKFKKFEKRYDSPWLGKNQRLFKLDPEFPLILSLQESTAVIENGQIKSVQKPTGLLLGRTAWPLRLPESAESVKDAFFISMAYKGRIDLQYLSQLSGNEPDECKAAILNEELAFVDPESGLLVDSAEYLSGNVRTKLETAEAFLAENPQLTLNVEALKKVQPESIGIDSINFRLGSQWISAEVLNLWSKNSLSGNLKFSYSKKEYKWYINGYCADDPAFSSDRVTTKRLIESTLALRNIEVYDRITVDGTERRVLNEKETAYALEKQAALKENFEDFVKNNPQAYKLVEDSYNRSFNSFAPKEYKVPPVKYFPGASQMMEGRDYQKCAVIRAVHEPVLLAHAVGAGKTFEIITAVMEKKRLGIARKSMIVVQNATVAQFATFAKQLYPNSKILAPLSKSEYAAGKRRLFLSRIAGNDWDAVIIPQSFFNLIKDDPQFVKEYYEERIEEYKAAVHESGDKITVRNMEKAIEKLQAAADSYIHEKGDDTLYFSQLGVDCLVLDEAHEYKKVGIATSMGAVKGLDTGVSQRAQRAYMKIRYIRKESNGRNVILATGTPITNTLAELYTMLRLTSEKTLESYGIFEFDQFAAVFTEAVTAPELTSTNKLKMVTRLSKFINQPELIRMFRTSADVITGTQLSRQEGVEKPLILGGRPQAVVIPRGEWLGCYIDSLQAELERFENMSGKERKENSHIPLTVMSRARKAAIDPRLIGYVEGLGIPPDDPQSKTNTVVKEILRIVAETDDLNGTQMVFSDLFQSPDGSFNLFRDIKEKLVSGGMSENEVAVIHDYKTDSQRERLFADMNSGKIRVLLGTTDRMGVGVNAQERMKAMHHMDAPWMPMQMEQRIGRIVRHGNIYAHNGGVYVQTYGVEKTMDAAIFQKILTKQKFIEAILEGNVNERVIEDESSDMALSAQEFTALFSGNPDVMRKFELESAIKTLRIQKESWRRQMRTSRDRLEILKVKQVALQELIPLANEKLTELEKYANDLAENRRVEIDGQLIADEELKETLDNLAKMHLGKAAILAGADGDESVIEIPEKVTVNGRRIIIKTSILMDWVSGQPKKAEIIYTCDNCHPFDISGKVGTGFGVLTSFKQAVTTKPAELMMDMENRLTNLSKDREALEEFLSKPFRREDELLQKESELATIVLDQSEEPEKSEPEMSQFRKWLNDKDVKQIASNCRLNENESNSLQSFIEGERASLPITTLWKISSLFFGEKLIFTKDEVEPQEADSDLIQAYQRAVESLEIYRNEASQKSFESTQVNADSISREIMNEMEALSRTLHGQSDGNGLIWDHSRAVWVDEAYVPELTDRFTNSPEPEYVKSLVRRYNMRIETAQSVLSSLPANKMKI